MRIRINWQWKEDRFIDELDKRLKYNWRENCEEADDFYSTGTYYRTVFRKKEKPKTLVCTV